MKLLVQLTAAAAIAAFSGSAAASLNTLATFSGNVGLSVDGVGGNNAAVGDVQAEIPIGATILRAYLYSAGLPFPFYSDAPTTLLDYNTSGITLAGNVIDNFDTLVGATSTPRPDIGRWFTARADVTSLVRTLTMGAGTSSFNWAVTEGTKNLLIDGEALVIVYSDPSRPLGSIALLDGGQDTGGETSTVNLGTPLSDPNAAGFAAELGVAISFSCCNQKSTIKINGTTLTDNAGQLDDGDICCDGALITVGGLGDPLSLPNPSYADDHEHYDLRPFLSTGDTSFSIFTNNATGDDNIFFASLYLTGDITDVTPNNVPEPAGLGLMVAGLGALTALSRRRKLN